MKSTPNVGGAPSTLAAEVASGASLWVLPTLLSAWVRAVIARWKVVSNTSQSERLHFSTQALAAAYGLI